MSVVENIHQALEEQDIDKVYELYHQFFDQFDEKKDMDILVDLADYTVEIGFFEEARRAFLKLAELEPSQSIWTIKLAEIYVAEGESDQALNLLYDIPASDENYVVVLLLQAATYQEQGYMDVAEQKLLKAKQLAPTEAVIDFYLGALLFEVGQLSRSLYFLEQYVNQETHTDFHKPASQFIMEAKMELDEQESVIPLVEQVDYEESDLSLLNKVGQFYYQQGDYHEAKKVYQALITRFEDRPALYYYLAQVYTALKEYDQSNECLQQVYQRDSYFAEAYALQSYNEQYLGHKEKAIQYAKKAHQYDEDNLEYLVSYVHLLEQAGEYEVMVQLLETIDQNVGLSAELYYLQALAYNELEQYEQANASFEQASYMYGEHPEFLADYGQFLLEEGRVEDAKRLIIRGVDIDPLNERLAELYSRVMEE